MKQERALLIEGRKYTLLISDEPQALLEAKASGRAVLGCMSSGKTDEKATDSWDLNGIPYVIPSIEYATDELKKMRRIYRKKNMGRKKKYFVIQISWKLI